MGEGWGGACVVLAELTNDLATVSYTKQRTTTKNIIKGDDNGVLNNDNGVLNEESGVLNNDNGVLNDDNGVVNRELESEYKVLLQITCIIHHRTRMTRIKRIF